MSAAVLVSNRADSVSTAKTSDTIAAVATAAGQGGIGIVRVSGPKVPALAGKLLGFVPRPRYARLCWFRDDDGQPIDQGLSLYFPEPRSFTGEHVLELHGHGGPVVLDLLLQRVLQLGARLARPGEFSERAFRNGRMDLAQAEAVADLIASGTAAAARAALGSLDGVFSTQVRTLSEQLIKLRVYVEAAIDFPEEETTADSDFLALGSYPHRQLGEVRHTLSALLDQAQQGRILRDGMTVVIAGRPNAGKSSLLNQLSGHDSAIVSTVAGTTRDVLREQINIDGMPLRVIDTAGLRASDDIVEREGVRRAWREISAADRVLLVIDDTQNDGEPLSILGKSLPPGLAVTVVVNKIDLTGRAAAMCRSSSTAPDLSYDSVYLSAKTGQGLSLLREHLKTCMGYRAVADSGSFSARRRHIDALQRADAHLYQAREQLEVYRAGELVAEELRLAHQALAEITGEYTSDDLLGEIFATFCLGK